MSTPGFTAEASLAVGPRQYLMSTILPVASQGVVPQGDTACEMACTVGYEAATAACIGLTGPAAPVCYAAAMVVYAACLRACV